MIDKKLVYKIFIISLPLLAIILANAAVAAHFKNFCLIKLIFHHECWGCGLTRAFAAFFRGDFVQAYNYNHLIVIVLPLLFCIWLIYLKNAFLPEIKDESVQVDADVKQ